MIKFVKYSPITSSKKRTEEDEKNELLQWLLADSLLSPKTAPAVVSDVEKEDDEKGNQDPIKKGEPVDIPKVDRSVYVAVEPEKKDNAAPEPPVVTPKIEQAAQKMGIFSDNSGVVLKPSYGKITIGSDINISSNVNAMLEELLKAGFRGIITRGHEPGAKTAQGADSWHGIADYHAIDVIPFADTTWEQFNAYNSVINIANILKKYGYGILDETDPEVMKKTNASGPHLHIGRDKIATGKLGGSFNPYK